MTIELLSRQELQLLNKQGLQYPLAIAEQDYFLALVLKILYSSPLKDVLVFKGGTALHHTYLPQLRFSQDLDFTALRKVTIDELKLVFDEYEFLEIKKHYTSSATVKIERLLYRGVLDMPASLRLEIDFTQNVVLPSRDMKYKNHYNVDAKASVMDIREICAEKIRAMNERYRYRDFYDFGMIMRKFNFNLSEIVDLLRTKELRKSLAHDTIMEHWKLARNAKQKDIEQIYVSEEIPDTEIAGFLQKIQTDRI